MSASTPSAALRNEGLGRPTTPQAVARVLKAAGYQRLQVWQPVNRRDGGIWVSAYSHTDEVLTFLQNKGYAVERPTPAADAVVVYGRRPQGRSRFIEGQTVDARPTQSPPASTETDERPHPGQTPAGPPSVLDLATAGATDIDRALQHYRGWRLECSR